MHLVCIQYAFGMHLGEKLDTGHALLMFFLRTLSANSFVQVPREIDNAVVLDKPCLRLSINS